MNTFHHRMRAICHNMFALLGVCHSCRGFIREENTQKAHLEVLKMINMLVVRVVWLSVQTVLCALVPNDLSIPRNHLRKLWTTLLRLYILLLWTLLWCFIPNVSQTMTEIRDLILVSRAFSWQHSPETILFFIPKFPIVIFLCPLFPTIVQISHQNFILVKYIPVIRFLGLPVSWQLRLGSKEHFTGCYTIKWN